MKTKDAVVDQFMARFEQRPDVDKNDPTLRIWVRGSENQFMVAIDTSGESLFKRGYREETVPAPAKEHLAAGLLLMTEWDRKTPLVDLMCGSGTFLIEGALIALNMAPGTLRKEYAFQKLQGFNKEAYKKVVREVMAQENEDLDFKFYGFDIDRDATKAAKENVRAVGLDHLIEIQRSGVDMVSPPCETGMIIVNPPYGERLERDEDLLKDAYRDLAFALKKFKGWTAWVLSPRRDMLQLLGMKYTRRYEVMNGPLKCEFVRYDILSLIHI